MHGIGGGGAVVLVGFAGCDGIDQCAQIGFAERVDGAASRSGRFDLAREVVVGVSFLVCPAPEC